MHTTNTYQRFKDLVKLNPDTVNKTGPELGRLLGISESMAKRYRRKYQTEFNITPTQKQQPDEVTERVGKDGVVTITETVNRRLSDEELYERYGRNQKEWRISMVWFKDKSGGKFLLSCCFIPLFKNGIFELSKKISEDLQKSLIKYSPRLTRIKRDKIKDGHLMAIDMCDIHIGKFAEAYQTGENYNVKIAQERIDSSVDKLIQYTSAFPLDKILVMIGNDIAHTDNGKSTTKGTPQDTDGSWFSNFLIIKDIYVKTVEKLLNIADLHIIHDPSNHDYIIGWTLAQVLYAHFRLSPNITWDISLRHRKAYVYHSNLIGSTHNDGAKENDLPLLMAQEFPVEWSKTKHRYIYTKHLHHKTAKDRIGVSMETSRSLSSADAWHSKSGYQHNPLAMECYIHSKYNGQIARFTAIVDK